ncbi:MAG: hypothetical protein AAF539_01175 [Planctomycetota bacterium]
MNRRTNPATRNAMIMRMIGLAFWMLCSIGVATSVYYAGDPSSNENGLAVVAAALRPSGQTIELVDPTGNLRVGDSAFMPNAEEASGWQQIGDVIGVSFDDNRSLVRLRTYGMDHNLLQTHRTSPAQQRDESLGNHPKQSTDQLIWHVHRSSGRIDDVLTTLIPDAKREQLIDRISEGLAQHGDAIFQSMMPLMMSGVSQSLPLIEAELRQSWQRHEPEIRALLTRYQSDIIEERLVPLARKEILPVLETHAAEPAETIGREIWDRASLWRFGWRAMYDKSPLPKRDMLQEEWQRFVDAEVVPIIESHVDDIVVAIQRTMVDLAGNDRLRDEIGQVISEIASDPEAQRLLRVIVSEAIVENRPLRNVWATTWTSPAAEQALESAGRRIEPLLRSLADEVIGTRESGIEPGFARVLRNQILGKDRTWITLSIEPQSNATVMMNDRDTGNGPSGDLAIPVLKVADEFAVFPIVHLATE